MGFWISGLGLQASAGGGSYHAECMILWGVEGGPEIQETSSTVPEPPSKSMQGNKSFPAVC